jgi:cytoskeletal protein CcmA (bactofilin family)
MMFEKETDKLESFLGKNSLFKGDLNVQGTLRIDGRIEGQLEADHLILSESAVVKGEVKAKRLIVGGTVDGSIDAQELVEIKSKGKVLGDIFTRRLAISEGGEVNGKIEMKKEESNVVELDLRGRETARM